MARRFGLYLGGLAEEDRLRRGDLESLGLEEVTGALADLQAAGRVLGMMAGATLEAPASLAEVQLARKAAETATKLQAVAAELERAVATYRQRAPELVTDASSDRRRPALRGPGPTGRKPGSGPARPSRSAPGGREPWPKP